MRKSSAPVRVLERQRGVALITAVLIVALATILATKIGFDSALEQRRSAGILLLDQALQVGLGAEAWAASYLRDDAANTQDDHPGERWATPIPPIPIDGGQIEGQLEDASGKFNLNALIDSDGRQNPEGVREFKQLLAILELEPKWADVLTDWLDVDTTPLPEGGEDSLYLSQAPPYRPPNLPITSVSELLAFPEFGLERYQKLRPYVTALPVGTPVNTCTASGAVLDALGDGSIQYSILPPDTLAKQRESGCFPTRDEVLQNISDPLKQEVQKRLAMKSDFFALRTFITIGTSEFSLYSLLHRDQGQVRPIMRNFGAD